MNAPIYIQSRGRWKTQLTSRALHDLGMKHYVVVERDELAEYDRTINPSATLLVLDPEYQRTFDRVCADDEWPGNGAGPARNFSWDHAISLGARWHWAMDDNIGYFMRLHRNRRVPLQGNAGRGGFDAMEAFVDRYENILMAGPHNFTFVHRKTKKRPFVWNTRVYSCNLIRTDAPFRWVGRYNDDTNLSLSILTAGYCTVLFTAFLMAKKATMTMKGGYAEAYGRDGRMAPTELLMRMHPDVTRAVWKWNRWHHEVDYKRFSDPKSKWYCHPRLRPDAEIPDAPDEYGLVYMERAGNRWVPADFKPKGAPGA